MLCLYGTIGLVTIEQFWNEIQGHAEVGQRLHLAVRRWVMPLHREQLIVPAFVVPIRRKPRRMEKILSGSPGR